jgi:hypothetical protein
MILKTYSRIFTSNIAVTLAPLRRLVSREPEIRVAFLDMEVLTIGGFCIVSVPAESIQPFLGAVGPAIVEDIEATRDAHVAAGAAIVQPIQDAPTGPNMFSRTSDVVVIEWFQWRADVWEQLNVASAAA